MKIIEFVLKIFRNKILPLNGKTSQKYFNKITLSVVLYINTISVKRFVRDIRFYFLLSDILSAQSTF